MSARHTLLTQLAQQLSARRWRLATAESCTGGGIGAAVTALAGSSAWFEGGVISYSNHLKQQLLGVPAALLEQVGAVSQPVVEAMAYGVLERLGVEVAVAVSGIAGPDGGSAEKPVGTVWLAWAGPWGVQSEVFCFRGDRQQVREQAIDQALQQLLQLVQQDLRL
ncbi:CinA family protein [Balneatrix alpica]|uniref:CinA family protein n=1 Tax=Balneatrix alpica TaxID=75684 RepID=A0ABV5Z930_9GAMM|nr:CinA family protein [Balneatrix alpica]